MDNSDTCTAKGGHLYIRSIGECPTVWQLTVAFR
jgi:hypothetical protein